MNRKFKFEFEDQSSKNSISFEYDDAVEEKMTVVVKSLAIMYANCQAFLALAKIFVKVALYNNLDGFHIHLRKDFDGEQPEILRVILNND